jgi:hypothetical protein
MSRQELEPWVLEELSQADFGDQRLTKRAMLLVSDLAARPEASVPHACADAAATKGAYRFWDHEQVTPEAIRAAHCAKTVERVQPHRTILAIQDTTTLTLDSHPKTEGLGPLDAHGTQGMQVHAVLAVSTQGVPLGLLHQQVWARDPQQRGKKHKRKQVPIEEQESYRWLQSLTATGPAVAAGTHVITGADREADIDDLFALPRPAHMDLLIRAAYNRRVEADEQTGKLWDLLQESPAQGRMSVHLEPQPGQKARDATLTLRYKPFSILPPAPKKLHAVFEPIRLWAILVTEENPPQGQEPLCWLLLTTLPVETFTQAEQCVRCYRGRWLIERDPFVLQSGGRLEELQLQTAARLARALATYCVVAWRLLWLTYQARETPQVSCEVVFQPHEWHALYAIIHRTVLVPATPPTLQQAVRWVAQLGGFLGRTSDGDPGVQTIWGGLRRLDDLVAMWLLLHSSSPPASLTYG